MPIAAGLSGAEVARTILDRNSLADVPVEATGRKAAQIVRNARFKVYEGAGHGIAGAPGEKEKFNQDLLDFLQS